MAQLRSLNLGITPSVDTEPDNLSIQQFHAFTSRLVSNLRTPSIPLPSNVGDYNLATFFQEHVFESRNLSKNTLEPLDKYLERNLS